MLYNISVGVNPLFITKDAIEKGIEGDYFL